MNSKLGKLLSIITQSLSMNSNINCFYVAYQTAEGISWRIINTKLNLDNSLDLQEWIRLEEIKRETSIIPVFWKRLDD